MTRRTLVWIAGATVVTLGVFAACSLDLDESLIAGNDDAGGDVSAGGSGGSAGWANGGGAGAGVGGFAAAPADAGPCDANAQCAIDGGCLEGRCVSGECQYAICPSSAACEGRSCDFGAKTCSEASALSFKAYQLAVGADIGCGGNAQRCIATAGDYVFVGTAGAGVRAWHVTTPLSPVPVNLEQPPFVVNRLISNGTRVLVVGTPAAGSLSLAWIDVPSDGIPTDLSSQGVLVNYSAGFSQAYPADADDFFLVHNDAGNYFPSVHLDLPIGNGENVTLHPASGIPAGETIVGSSGSRLVGYRTDTSGSTWVPTFSLESNAGTPSAQNGGEQQLGIEAPTSVGAHRFVSTHDGTLLWSTNRIVREDGSVFADAVVFRVPLVGAGTSFSATPEVVLETYSAYGTEAARAGISAMIDPSTFIATAAYPADTGQSTVRGVTKSGSDLVLAGGPDVIPFATGSLGVEATRRFGFVLTPSTTVAPDPPNTALRIYAPGCGG